MNKIGNLRKYLKDILYIGILIVILIIAKDWVKDKIIVSLGGYTHQTKTITIDSTFIKGKVDTLAIFNHYVKTNGIILNPKARVIYRDNPDKKIKEKDTLKEFTVNVTDSLISGDFTVLNNFKGDLISADFKYKPLYPKILRRVDTLRIETKEESTLTNKRSLIGLGGGFNNLSYLSITGSYITKKNWQVLLEYGKPLNEVKSIYNQGVPFEVKRNDLWSIKLIKHF